MYYISHQSIEILQYLKKRLFIYFELLNYTSGIVNRSITTWQPANAEHTQVFHISNIDCKVTFIA
jgi:hypothetical protein